jgi:hypothetical protein
MRACQSPACREACRLQHHETWDVLRQEAGTSPAANGWAWTIDAGMAYQPPPSACAGACGNNWTCVGHVSWPPATATSIAYSFLVTDGLTGSVVPSVNVNVCPLNDLTCRSPITSATTDDAGAALLRFPNQALGASGLVGFTGFLALQSPAIAPQYYFWGYPLTGPVALTYTTTFTPPELDQLLYNANVMQAADRGFVQVAVYDCTSSPAVGVQVSLSNADTVTQSFTTLGVKSWVTPQNAELSFTNVPTGVLDVIATPPSLTQPSSRVTVAVDAGASSVVLLYPTP